jgi:ABC-type Na+ efflux pump permease subunit
MLKDIGAALRERTFVSIILLQLFVASLASIITIGMLVLYNPTFLTANQAKVGLVGSAPVLAGILKPEKRYERLDEAFEDFYAGKIDAIVYLPKENTSENFITVYLPKEEVVAIAATSYLREKLIEYEARLRSMSGIPGKIPIKIYSPEMREIEEPNGISSSFKFIYMVLIPLLVITTALSAGGLFIDLISEEIESRTAHVLLSSPLRPWEIIVGKVAAALVLSAILTPVWLGLLMINGIDIANPELVLVLTLSISSIFVAVACFSSLSGDRERAQLVFSLAIVGLLPLFYISPFMPSGLIARISAGSYFSGQEITLYVAISAFLLILGVKILEMRVREAGEMGSGRGQ